MRKINKSDLPTSIKYLNKKNKKLIYNDLNQKIKNKIRTSCVQEQNGLCAFCCKRITSDSDSSHNAHIKCQSLHPEISLDWNNIVASCNTKILAEEFKAEKICHYHHSWMHVKEKLNSMKLVKFWHNF